MTAEPKFKLNNTRYLILLLLIYFQHYYIARKGADLAPLLYKLEQKKITTVASTIVEQYFAQISSPQEI